MKDKILQLKKARREKEEAIRKEKELTVPALKDKELIPLIYEWVEELSDNESPEVTKYGLRQYFIIIICALCSPRILCGYKMERGTRDHISKFLLLSGAQISNIYENVCSWYSLYKDFQNHTNYLYAEIVSRLHEYDMIGGESKD